MSRRLLQVLVVLSSSTLVAAFITYRAGWWTGGETNAAERPTAFPGSKSAPVMRGTTDAKAAGPPAVEPAAEATLPGSKSFQILPLDEERAKPATQEPKDVMWSTKSAPVFVSPAPVAPETPASEPAEAEPILMK